MVSELNSNNLGQLRELREQIKDLEVEIMIKEKKIAELIKPKWYSILLGFIVIFFLGIPCAVSGFQQNWLVFGITLALIIAIVLAYSAFLNYGTKQGRQFSKFVKEVNLAKKKKKQLENKLLRVMKTK